MPFKSHSGGFQHASPLGHVPTVRHPLVAETLRNYIRPGDRTADEKTVIDMLLDPLTLPPPTDPVRYAIATDSSHLEPEVDPAFPSTRVLFMQIAAIIVDLEVLRTREGPFIDPVAVANAQQRAMLAGALPSSNLVRRDGLDPKTAFRQEIDTLFRRSEVQQQTMLDLLLEVEGARESPPPAGTLVMARCPECGSTIDGSMLRDGTRAPLLHVGKAGAMCPACSKQVMAIDALRVHESFDPHGTNAEACGRALSVIERLASLAVLNDVRKRAASILPLTAFVTDGPLALFGEVAPLRLPLLRRFQQIAHAQMERELGLPVIVGIEKSGMFAEHAQKIRPLIDAHLADAGGDEPRSLVVLNDTYVKQYITHATSTHGKETYYGRHFFYRSRPGAMFTITVPPLGSIGASSTDPFDLNDYPTLGATCDVLDRIGTRLYPDATIPVALAHEFAAYPLESATRVLKLHAEQILNETEGAGV